MISPTRIMISAWRDGQTVLYMTRRIRRSVVIDEIKGMYGM